MQSSAVVWTGRVLSGLFMAFMLAASIAPKLAGADVARSPLVALGWSADHMLMIGILELTFVALYAIPRTSVLGAVLMSALLGGAMAAHIRAGSPLFSHVLFGVYLGLVMWGGLWLRDAKLRAVFPWHTAA